MNKIAISIALFAFLLAATGCSGTAYHKKDLPDPAAFNAHFGDLDTDGDDQVSWEEFKTHFPEATMDIYSEIDLDDDNLIDHDEWHEFKQAHGLKHLD